MVEPHHSESTSGSDLDPERSKTATSRPHQALRLDPTATGIAIGPTVPHARPSLVFGSPGPTEVAGPPELEDYEIVGEIGRGGMGVVYQAQSRRDGEVVALKSVLSATPSSLYRFKQEFRALADVVHPNLVTLYELRAGGPMMYFTMEFIDGTDLASYVRQISWGAAGQTTGDHKWGTPTPSCKVDPRREPERVPRLSGTEIDRLRDALRQIASGLITLHAAGRLHRDLKPSNVMVTSQGRVVILDFGLAAELDRHGRHQESSGAFLGTPAYAAPEQAAASSLTPASDWYSVGAILYQLLTGRPPFEGGLLDVLREKQRRDPPTPSTLADGIPKDLDELCRDLLHRVPAARPTGREVLRRLQGLEPASAGHGPSAQVEWLVGTRVASSAGSCLIGRGSHLQALTEAYQSVCARHTVIAMVHGPSGMGKTSLIERFLDDLRERESAVILTGRCYEAESVPFKALDSLMDGLSEYLRRLPEELVETLLPREATSLARVFPVFQRVEAIARLPIRTETSDERELRRRAVGGLRELLTRLGRRPLVLFIDDLQWGDVDSATMLADVLEPPDPPAMLLLGSYRSELAESSPFLQSFRRIKGISASAIDRREMAVARLTESEAQELAFSRLTTGWLTAAEEQTVQERARAIARESLGSPFFIDELAQHVREPSHSPENPSPAHPVRLDEVLWARVQRLPPPACRLLEVTAVAGKPLPLAQAGEAAELPADGSQSL